MKCFWKNARSFLNVFSLRGLLLIVAILLVGTGFTFVKHALSGRERKLFIIAIPLQVYIYKVLID